MEWLVVLITSSISFALSFFILIYFVFRRLTIWDEPPQCLIDPQYGIHGFLKLKNVRIHFVEKGDRTKKLMLFLHGFPEFWYSWRYQITEFSDEYWTVAVDMRGYGDSDKPKGRKNYTVDVLVQDVKQIIEALGKEKCIIVAHDWGGVISWYFINKYPNMVERYIIMNAPYLQYGIEVMFANPQQILKSWYVWCFQFPIVSELMFMLICVLNFRKLFRGNKHKPFHHITSQDIEAYQHTFRKPGRLTGPMNYYRVNILRSFRKESVQSHHVPGLILFGECDEYLVPEFVAAPLKVLKNLQMRTIQHAGHFVQQHDPAGVNTFMKEFLQQEDSFDC